MSAETAQLVLYSITAGGVVFWLCSTLFFIWSAKAGKQPAAERFDVSGTERQSGVFGSAEIEGQPADLAATAAAVLVGESAGPISPLKILEKTDDRVRFEGVSRLSSRQNSGRCVGRGELRFRNAGHGRTRVEYEIEVGGKGLLIGGTIFVLLGLIALAVGFWLIRTYAVPNQNPAIRGQTFQMFQAYQFLWEPFLFGGLYLARYRAVCRGFDALIHNLPYHRD